MRSDGPWWPCGTSCTISIGDGGFRPTPTGLGCLRNRQHRHTKFVVFSRRSRYEQTPHSNGRHRSLCRHRVAEPDERGDGARRDRRCRLCRQFRHRPDAGQQVARHDRCPHRRGRPGCYRLVRTRQCHVPVDRAQWRRHGRQHYRYVGQRCSCESARCEWKRWPGTVGRFRCQWKCGLRLRYGSLRQPRCALFFSQDPFTTDVRASMPARECDPTTPMIYGTQYFPC